MDEEVFSGFFADNFDDVWRFGAVAQPLVRRG